MTTLPNRKPQPMTSERLAEIEARANAATPGPWTLYGEHNDSFEFESICGREFQVDFYETNSAQSNAEFIAAARTDVPDLCARVRELDGDNEDLKELVKVKENILKQALERIKELETRIEEMEEEARHEAWERDELSD